MTAARQLLQQGSGLLGAAVTLFRVASTAQQQHHGHTCQPQQQQGQAAQLQVVGIRAAGLLVQPQGVKLVVRLMQVLQLARQACSRWRTLLMLWEGALGSSTWEGRSM
jgi:hypothetical protein